MDTHVTHKESGKPQSNSNEIRVAGSDRVYSRNKLLVVLLVPLMMSLMQVSSINTVLTSIQTSIGASDSELQWIISGYALSIGIFLVPAGRLGDLFGRSAGFVSGLAIFSVASLLIGFSQDALTLNLMRVAQGLGSGVLSPQATGLIQQYFEGKERARAFGLFGLVVAASVAAGPVLSGTLIALFGPEVGWRSSFFLNFPLGIVGVIMAFFWLPFGKERRTIGPKKDAIEREYEAREAAAGHEVRVPAGRGKIDLDPFGAVLLALAVVAVMIPFMIKGSPWFYLLVLLGAALMALWVTWERKYKERGGFPMVDLDLFQILTFRYSMLIVAVFFLGMTSVWAVLMIFLQNAAGATPFELGMMSLPNAVLSGVASVWAGKHAIEHGRAIQVWCLALYAAGLLGCIGVTYLVYLGYSWWWFVPPTLLMGLGGGAMGSANQTQAMLDVPASSGGTAGGVLQTGQRMATAIGIAIITAVFFAVRGPVPARAATAGVHWYVGISAAFAVSAAIILVAMVIALRFLRKGRPLTT